MSCPHPKRDYFYSVYTNKRICRHCWTDEPEEHMTFSTATTNGTPTPDEVFANVQGALLKINEETEKTAAIMAEFTTAFEEAQNKGIGVVVVRKRDGSITSTPNVFVTAGTAIFMDEPGDWSQSIRQGIKFSEEITPEEKAA